MLLLQASIGALNDVVDAPRDAGRKPGKPIPAGLVSRQEGRAVAAGAAAGGLILAFATGVDVGILATLILATGWLYDLRLKGTAWSWLPFAVGIPLLPVFAWLGAGTALPAWFPAVIAAAMMAGAGLAVGNALVDVERDRSAGITSVAARVGRARALVALTVLYAAVLVLALVAHPAREPAVALVVGLAGMLLALGIAMAGGAHPATREWGWRLQVVAVGGLAIGWFATLGGVLRPA